MKVSTQKIAKEEVLAERHMNAAESIEQPAFPAMQRSGFYFALFFFLPACYLVQGPRAA
jgi:hypothetical protein